MRRRDLLHITRDLLQRLSDDVSLHALARRSGWSRFHLQRAFRRSMGESPKQYTSRLRLERAAARLAASDDSVLRVAFEMGFASHEVFIRAFQRQFGCAPARYRAAALKVATRDVWARHLALTTSIGPCVKLFRISDSQQKEISMPLLSVVRKEVQPLPVLFVRRRCARAEVSATLAECFGIAYGHAQSKGLPIAGFPIARYVTIGPGLMTIDAGVPLATPASGEGELRADTLPGGPVAFAIHGGPYDGLGDTMVAVERWVEANGYQPAGPHWEWYVNDPAEHPNPADWRTEIYWPLA